MRRWILVVMVGAVVVPSAAWGQGQREPVNQQQAAVRHRAAASTEAVIRTAARDAARREADQRVRRIRQAPPSQLTQQWKTAVREAERPRITDLFGVREIVLLAGIGWIALEVRAIRARRRRARRRPTPRA